MKALLIGTTLLSIGLLFWPQKIVAVAGKTYRWRGRITPPMSDTERIALGSAMTAAQIPFKWGRSTADYTELEYTLIAPESATYEPGKTSFDLMGKTLTVYAAKEVAP